MMHAGWLAILFADDIAISAGSRPLAEQALDKARETIETLDLELNLGKSHIHSFDDGVPFLGATVGTATGRRADTSAKPLDATVSVTVTTAGSWIRSRGDRIVVQQGENALLRLHVNRVRQIVAVGRVGVTTPFLRTAAREGIDVVLLDETAGSSCRIVPPAARDPRARIAQHQRFANANETLDLATRFVMGKSRTCGWPSCATGRPPTHRRTATTRHPPRSSSRSGTTKRVPPPPWNCFWEPRVQRPAPTSTT